MNKADIKRATKIATKRMNEKLEEMKISNTERYLDIMRFRNATLFRRKK